MKIISSLGFLLLILAAPCLGSNPQILTTKLDNGILNDSYFSVITAVGGCAPYVWNIVAGTLPAGVTKKPSPNTTSLILSGKPTTAASYSFTVSVTGCGGGRSEASYKVVVQAAADHLVGLNWEASSTPDVVGYNVYRGPDGSSWKRVNLTLNASTTYSDSTVADRSAYYYATTAVDVHGMESKKSNIVEIVIP